MTLATHIVIAAAVTSPIAGMHPGLIFAAAVASHYLSDAVPHWDYGLQSLDEEARKKKKKRWKFTKRSALTDFIKVSIDGLIGSAAVFAIARPASQEELIWFALAVIGGVLPDFLQGVHFFERTKFLNFMQRFHDAIHTKIKLGPYPLVGIPFQALFFFGALLFLW